MRVAFLGATVIALGCFNANARAGETVMLGGVGSFADAQVMTLQGSAATDAETINAYFPVARGVARAGARVAWGAGRVAVGGARWAGGYRPWIGGYRPWGWGYRPWVGGFRPWGGYYRPWVGFYRPWIGGYRSWGCYQPYCDYYYAPSYYWGCADDGGGYASSAFDTPATDYGAGFQNLSLPANQPEQAAIILTVSKPATKKLEYPAYGESTDARRKTVVISATGSR